MTTTTYYFPSVDGAGASAGGTGFSGVQNFQGQFQAAPGSYTVVTANTATPGVFQVIFNYTGPGTGTPDTTYQTAYSDANHSETTDGVYDFILTNGPVPANYTYPFSSTSTPFVPTAGTTTDPTVCFASGTLIRTSRGDKPVEDLRLGDMLEIASGAYRAIKWLGHRTVDCHRHPRMQEALPIRICAHAFGEGRPSRDLRVSPGHAICVDAVGEVLIPAAALLNGTTIVQEEVPIVTYWHVELEGGHDIILAENLPCESYLDMGNRTFFSNSEVMALHAGPDAPVATHANFCRPFHQGGSVVTFVRERLIARAPDLGWTLDHVPLANVHLLVDGKRVEPSTRGLAARFLVPRDAAEVWLVSDTSVPAELGLGTDWRKLGVCLGSLVVDDGFAAPRTILPDDPLLGVGFHDVEDGPQRWTCGRARLDKRLWDECRGAFFLRVELTRPALPSWSSSAALHEDGLCTPLADGRSV